MGSQEVLILKVLLRDCKLLERLKLNMIISVYLQDHSDVFETVGLLSQSVNKLFAVANQVRVTRT